MYIFTQSFHMESMSTEISLSGFVSYLAISCVAINIDRHYLCHVWSVTHFRINIIGIQNIWELGCFSIWQVMHTILLLIAHNPIANKERLFCCTCIAYILCGIYYCSLWCLLRSSNSRHINLVYLSYQVSLLIWSEQLFGLSES